MFTNAAKTYMTAEFKKEVIVELGLDPSTKFGPRIGDASTNGAVFPILGTDKVFKVSIDPSDGDFRTEVEIGHKPGISAIGTRVYQSKLYTRAGKKVGMYVMDNLIKSTDAPGTTVMSLLKYNESIKGACPPKRVLEMLVRMMFDFYRISEGWHGDLHFNNIQVVLGPSKDVIRTIVIDYGSHKRFKNVQKVKQATCLDDILRNVRKNFRSIKTKTSAMFWKTTQVRHKTQTTPNRGQWVINNKAVLNDPEFHPWYKHAKNAGLHTKKFSPPPGPAPKSPPKRASPRNLHMSGGVTPGGRKIYRLRGTGVPFVFTTKGTKNYKRVKKLGSLPKKASPKRASPKRASPKKSNHVSAGVTPGGRKIYRLRGTGVPFVFTTKGTKNYRRVKKL